MGVDGDTATETAGVTVMVAAWDFEVSETDVAARVTPVGLG